MFEFRTANIQANESRQPLLGSFKCLYMFHYILKAFLTKHKGATVGIFRFQEI